MDQPILRHDELETLRAACRSDTSAPTIDITWPVTKGPRG